MSYTEAAQSAADWALDKVGYPYSQAKRTKENTFDCSSLVARAYSAQGKRWRYGGEVPVSCDEVYDDEFQLLWPEAYAEIGKKLGGKSVLTLAQQPGDLQFLCTDSGTDRSNRITHVTMVISPTQIVHARGTKYGVRKDAIDHYAGKVCALARYNPAGALRLGMKGFRTLRLQQALNCNGADVTEDGEFGQKTRAALRDFQQSLEFKVTGETNFTTLFALGLDPEARPAPAKDMLLRERVRVTGDTVYLRTGPGKEYESVKIAKLGETYEAVDANGWVPVLLDGSVCWLSARYAVVESSLA